MLPREAQPSAAAATPPTTHIQCRQRLTTRASHTGPGWVRQDEFSRKWGSHHSRLRAAQRPLSPSSPGRSDSSRVVRGPEQR